MMEEYKLYLDRAEKAFESFRILRERGLYEDAISRGYYAIVHLCFALLVKHGIDVPKTHSGLLAKVWNSREMLGIGDEILRNLSRLQSLRENGDYSILPSIGKEDLELVEVTFKTLRGLL